MYKSVFFTLFLLTVSSPANAAGQPACPLAVHEGPLCGQLLVVDAKSMPPHASLSDALKMPDKIIAHRGEKITLEVLAGGLSHDANGNIDLKTRIFIAGSGQSPQELGSTEPGGVHRQQADDAMFAQAGYNAIAFENSDPFGTYTITAEVEDKLAQKIIHLSKQVTLLP